MKSEKEFEKYINKIKQLASEEGYDSLDETYIEHLRARFYGEDVVIGRSERIVLREMKMSDLKDIYAFEDAKEESVLRAFIKENEELSEAYLRSYIANAYPMYDYGIWSAELLESGELIGLCGLGQTEIDGEFCTDLGYYICPKWRKKGLASECVEITLDYVKNYLEFPFIYAIIKGENRNSKGIMRKFGFECIKMRERSDGVISVYQKDLTE